MRRARRLGWVIAGLAASAGAVGAAQVFDHLDVGRLQRSLKSYMGTPYLYGGTSHSGIDCSGLVLAIYRDQGIELPRTAREQYRVGESVPADRLRVGDLVFFNTAGHGVSHVGIVNGAGTFVQAGTSTGVAVASLHDPYWRSRYIGARRIASGSTYFVSGSSIGAAASDRVALVNRYPFIDYELIDIPTNQVAERRAVSIQLRTNVAGDVVLQPQVSFWNRVQFAGFLRVGNVLGSGRPKVYWPDGLFKLRINDQIGHFPGFAIGVDTRRLRIVRDTIHGDSLTTTRRRGLFLVSSGTIRWSRGFWFGRMRGHAGANVHWVDNIRDFSVRRDVSYFFGLDQQVLRRVLLMAELDNVRGEGGWHVNVGVRMTITEDAVVEYSLLYLGQKGTRVDKVLKVSFDLPY